MSALKYAKRLLFVVTVFLILVSIIIALQFVGWVITGEWIEIPSSLIVVCAAATVFIATLTFYHQLKQGNEMIKSLQEELKYLTGKLYHEPKLKIMFWVPPKELKHIDYASQNNHEHLLKEIELQANREYEIVLRIEAEEKQSIRMIETGFRGGTEKKPEVIDKAPGIVKYWLKEAERDIYTTIWDYLNVAYSIPKRVPKGEATFHGIKVKTKEQGKYDLEVRITVDEAEKQLTKLLPVEVK